LSGDITAADVLSQGSCDLLSEVGWKLRHLRRLSCGLVEDHTDSAEAISTFLVGLGAQIQVESMASGAFTSIQKGKLAFAGRNAVVAPLYSRATV
jgi:hypothetical protein